MIYVDQLYLKMGLKNEKPNTVARLDIGKSWGLRQHLICIRSCHCTVRGYEPSRSVAEHLPSGFLAASDFHLSYTPSLEDLSMGHITLNFWDTCILSAKGLTPQVKHNSREDQIYTEALRFKPPLLSFQTEADECRSNESERRSYLDVIAWIHREVWVRLTIHNP